MTRRQSNRARVTALACIPMVLLLGMPRSAAAESHRSNLNGANVHNARAAVRTQVEISDVHGPIASISGWTGSMNRTVRFTAPAAGVLTFTYRYLHDEQLVQVVLESDDEEFQFSVPFPATIVPFEEMNLNALMTWEQFDTFFRFAPIARRIGTRILNQPAALSACTSSSSRDPRRFFAVSRS